MLNFLTFYKRLILLAIIFLVGASSDKPNSNKTLELSNTKHSDYVAINAVFDKYKNHSLREIVEKLPLLLNSPSELQTSTPINIAESFKDVSSFTQSNEVFDNLFARIRKHLNFDCRKSALLDYKSQQLTAPDGQKSALFEATLVRASDAKRIVTACSSSRQTLLRSMVVENGGRQFKLNTANLGYINLYKSFFVINPISFSPHSRFLVTRLDTLATITDRFRAYAIFDFQNNYRYLKLSICKDDQFGGWYSTFISDSEVVFKCDSETGKPYFEVIDLEKLSIRKESISQLNLANQSLSFGSITQEFTVENIE